MIDLGVVLPGDTILVPFQTFDSNDPSASVAIAAFVLADIGIYKGLSMTERASTTGVVLLDTDGIDLDAAVGIGGFTIDLSSNATAGFYECGQRYYVTVGPVTVDAAVVNFVAASFVIGFPSAIINTSVASATSDIQFILTDGPAEADVLIGCSVLIQAVAAARGVGIQFGHIIDYIVTTKEVFIAVDGGGGTVAANDHVAIFMPANVHAWAGIGVVAGAIPAVAADAAGGLVISDNGALDADAQAASVVAIEVDTGTTLPDLIGGLGGATGGSVSIETVLDNTLTGVSINNGGAAVDKSTSPATVGIPVTGHAFVAGQQVTLALTVAYNASFTVDSVSTNEVVIVSAFTGETFGANDIISSTVKTVGFIGSVQGATTVANTEALDGVFHDIDDTGDDIDIVYTFNVGAGRTGTELIFHGFVQGNSDIVNIEVYEHGGPGWEVLRAISGSNGSNVITVEVPLLLKHTGTTGVDAGKVFIRFAEDSATTPSNLSIDQLLVEAINTGALSAYENGQIWINTNASNENTVADVDGTSRRPVSTLAAAKTLSTSTGLSDFHVINGSSLTLAESTDNESYFGDNWTLALGGQSCASAHFEGAAVSGIQTGSGASFAGCEIGTVTLAADAHIEDSGLNAGTITLPAGSIHIDRCHHGGATPIILDFGAAVGSSTVHMHAYSGGVEVQNMGDSGTDIMHLDGGGALTVNANSSGGTINLNNDAGWKVTNNSAGTLVKSGTGILYGIAKTGTLSTTVATTNLIGFDDDQIIGRILYPMGGAAEGEISNITDYASASGTLTFATMQQAMADGDPFEIV